MPYDEMMTRDSLGKDTILIQLRLFSVLISYQRIVVIRKAVTFLIISLYMFLRHENRESLASDIQIIVFYLGAMHNFDQTIIGNYSSIMGGSQHVNNSASKF